MTDSYQSYIRLREGSERSFGFVFSAVFIFVSFYPVLYDGSFRWWALCVGIVLFFTSLFAPSKLAPASNLWSRFAGLLGRLFAPLIMTIVYFIVIVPVGYIMKALRYDLLEQRGDNETHSYWRPRDERSGSMSDLF